MNNNSLQNFDYNGNPIFKRADGFINLTQMCQANGKQLGHFLTLKSTKAYMACIESDTGKPISEIIEIVKGGNPVLQGSWGHPEIAIALAQWISPQFHRWCNAHIFLLMETGSTSLAVDPLEEMKLKIELAQLEKEKEALRIRANESEKDLMGCKNALQASDPVLYQVIVDGVPLAEARPLGFGKTIKEVHTDKSEGISLTQFMSELGGFERTKTGQFKQTDRAKVKAFLKELGIDLETGLGCTTNERITESYAIPDQVKTKAKTYVKSILSKDNSNLLEKLYKQS